MSHFIDWTTSTFKALHDWLNRSWHSFAVNTDRKQATNYVNNRDYPIEVYVRGSADRTDGNILRIYVDNVLISYNKTTSATGNGLTTSYATVPPGSTYRADNNNDSTTRALDGWYELY